MARLVTRTFYCPTCERNYDKAMREDQKPGPTERICSRCWARDMKESDRDEDAKAWHKPVD